MNYSEVKYKEVYEKLGSLCDKQNMIRQESHNIKLKCSERLSQLDIKLNEELKNNSEQGVVIIYSNSGNYLNKYQLSSFDEKKKYDYKNKKVILITANEMMVNHPDVDICLVYQHLSKLQTHSYIYPLINDLIVAEYRSFQNANF